MLSARKVRRPSWSGGLLLRHLHRDHFPICADQVGGAAR